MKVQEVLGSLPVRLPVSSSDRISPVSLSITMSEDVLTLALARKGNSVLSFLTTCFVLTASVLVSRYPISNCRFRPRDKVPRRSEFYFGIDRRVERNCPPHIQHGFQGFELDPKF